MDRRHAIAIDRFNKIAPQIAEKPARGHLFV
jgi:hypothetical protein